MKTVAYFDCPTGISGDMCLGALVSAGVPLAYLSEQLSKLGLADEYELSAKLVQRNGQQATKVAVQLHSSHEPTAPASNLDSKPAEYGQTHSNSYSDSAYSDGSDRPDRHHDKSSHSHSHSYSSSHSHSHHSHSHHSHQHQSSSSPSHRHSSQTRHLPEIEHLIQTAQLPSKVTHWSIAIFRQLAEAEAAVHGIPVNQVHFHEVGATDAVVDIVGTCLGLAWLNIDALYCSPLPTGGGVVRAAHGTLPVPAPAVLKLMTMARVPIYSNGIQKELVTPTGAAIATTLSTAFGPPPAMTLNAVGLGAGGRDLPIPNILRLWIGQLDDGDLVTLQTAQPAAIAKASSKSTSQQQAPSQTPSNPPLEDIIELQTQVDDLSPQAIGYLLDQLLTAGARDVFVQPLTMKKSRPGHLITVLCTMDITEICRQILFAETTTLGIRQTQQQRYILKRRFETVEIPQGSLRVKLGYHPITHELLNVQPEYEDCARLARQHQLPWQQVHQLALQTWLTQKDSSV